MEIASLAEGEAAIRTLAPLWTESLVIALSGEMGAGKTQITKWILATLGPEPGSSPTFAIHNRYSIGARQIDHFDLYRLESDSELENVGFWDALQSPNLVIVEWADRLPDEVFSNVRKTLFIHVSRLDDRKRVYRWNLSK